MKLEINEYLAMVLINIGLMMLIALTIYLTKTGWPLLGLLFICTSSKGEK